MIESFFFLLKRIMDSPAFVGALSGFIAIVTLLLYQRLRQTLPIAYNVAVVGFPRSGKTVLITSIFAQIFSDRFLSKKVILRTKATIERVNRDLEQLELGKALGPTSDQDLFAYRADIKRGGFPLQRTYKVHIGDFPGEDTKKFSEKQLMWLHETAYFKWVMEADSFIFIIDLAHVLADKNPNEYKANMTKAVRAAWQHLVEYHVEGKKDLRKKPVLLVFTKSDLIARKDKIQAVNDSNINEIHQKIMELGFDDKLPDVINCKKGEIDNQTDHILNEYVELIEYLKSQTYRFSCHFVSHFAKDEDGRLGIPSLVKRILPS